MGAVYLFHDLYGYLMEMSPDIAEMIEAFSDGVDTAETVAYYRGKLGDADPQQFVEVLAGHAVLVDPDEDELESLWAFVPIHGKWNVWRRREDRLTFWTAASSVSSAQNPAARVPAAPRRNERRVLIFMVGSLVR